MWDPAQYLNFADERGRPFYDLVGRIAASDPRHVVDLGCGPGQLTASLARRWPAADVLGIDSSAEMIAAAQQLATQASAPPDAGRGTGGRLRFVLRDVRDWRPGHPVDVIVSNAVLQWVPGHTDLLPLWAASLAPDGWLAFQVPGNFDQPSHVVLRDLIESPRWRPLLADVELNRQAENPARYVDLLARLGLTVDAWETTYLHVLRGDDPVTQWYKGTGLRPVLAALEPDAADEFTAEYSARVRVAYPLEPYGTVLPFRRVFVVAHKR